MAPIHYTAEILPDGHLPLPQGFPGRAGERVKVTIAPDVVETDEAVVRRQKENVLRDLVGAFDSGLPDVARRHDDHLYGAQGR